MNKLLHRNVNVEDYVFILYFKTFHECADYFSLFFSLWVTERWRCFENSLILYYSDINRVSKEFEGSSMFY